MRTLLRRWLGCTELEARCAALERQAATLQAGVAQAGERADKCQVLVAQAVGAALVAKAAAEGARRGVSDGGRVGLDSDLDTLDTHRR